MVCVVMLFVLHNFWCWSIAGGECVFSCLSFKLVQFTYSQIPSTECNYIPFYLLFLLNLILLLVDAVVLKGIYLRCVFSSCSFPKHIIYFLSR